MMLALLAEWALRSIALGAAAGLGLKVLRVRHAQLRMITWTVVLLASSVMPALTPWLRVSVPAEVMPAHLPTLGLVEVPRMLARALPGVQGFVPTTDIGASPTADAIDWHLPMTVIYIAVACVMLLRVVVGWLLMRRVVAAARAVRASWTGGHDLRVSRVVRVPVTFGSTILLPAEYASWTPRKRQAVLLHEAAHVAHGDAYVLLLAAIHRAIFWFNPFAWWLCRQLAELAEMISDDAVLAQLEDRRSYAEVLRDVARHDHRLPAGLAMASASTVERRLRRILRSSAVAPGLGRRQRFLIAAALLPFAALSGGTIVSATPPAAAALRTVMTQLDRFVGQYLITGASVLTVTRQGEHLFAQMTGKPLLQLTATDAQDFVSEGGAVSVAFRTAADGPATEVVLREQDNGAMQRARVDGATAEEVAARFDRRAAAAPERFRNQTPLPGGGAALRRMLDSLRQSSSPGAVSMSRQLSARVRTHVPTYGQILDALGVVEAIVFRGVGPNGYDIYDVTFSKGSAQLRIDLAGDGTIEDFDFQPDGDGTLGGAAACAEEPTLRALPDAAPIRLSLRNASGEDRRLFRLDTAGRRVPHGTLASNWSTQMFTAVGVPLVIADSSGECREIVLPGRLTRVHVIDAASAR